MTWNHRSLIHQSRQNLAMQDPLLPGGVVAAGVIVVGVAAGVTVAGAAAGAGPSLLGAVAVAGATVAGAAVAGAVAGAVVAGAAVAGATVAGDELADELAIAGSGYSDTRIQPPVQVERARRAKLSQIQCCTLQLLMHFGCKFTTFGVHCRQRECLNSSSLACACVY